MLQRNTLRELGQRTYKPERVPLWGSNSELSEGPPRPPSLPSPGHAPGPPRLPERYPLVDPAGLLMLAVPGRSGWWALPDSRPTAPTSPPGAAALQPPSSLRGSRAGQTGAYWLRAALLSLALRIRSTVEMEASLSFFPGSSKTAAAGDAA